MGEEITPLDYLTMVNNQLCQMAMMWILGVGVKVFRTAKESLIEGFGTHGCIGNTNATNLEMQAAMNDYFEEIKLVAEPLATSYVCEETPTEVKNAAKIDEKGILALPPYWSKHGLYAQFCWNVDGKWKPKTSVPTPELSLF
jgi:hypothetical protein